MIAKTPFLLLLITLSIVAGVSSAQRTAPPQPTVGREEGAPTASPLSQGEYTNDLQLIPGVTQSIEIQLKGEAEIINFEFQAQNTTFLYQVSTMINGQSEAQRFFNFTQLEAFQIELDYENKQASIVSDNDFFTSAPLQEDNYQIIVTQQRLLHNSEPLEKSDKKIIIITGAVGGSCALVILSFGAVCFLKRRKRIQCEVLPANNHDSSKRLQTETITTARDLIQKATENLETDCNDSKEIQATMDSTLSDSHRTQHTSKVPSISGARFLTEEDNTALDKIDESNDCEKSSVVEAAVLETNIFALDMADLEPCTKTRRMPTAREIRAMAHKMEEEGLIGCDVSEDSDDDEDQYEAPQLPNYFCCMICFEGKRCTIAEPCRHIFACQKCVEELLETYKVCVLCSKDISNYELL